MKEKVLIVGLGQVGRAIFELFTESGKFEVYGFDVNKRKMHELVKRMNPPEKIDVMHICYTCADSQSFIQTTLGYIRRFGPKITIVESTVSPGTTQKISNSSDLPVVHSPIRGMHRTLETMKNDILFWTKYIGGTTKESAKAARRHYEKLGLKVKVLRSPIETEMAKLFETTYKAWMIVCFQEMHRISRSFGANFVEVVDMIEDAYRRKFNKPLNYPGVIGGHCLIPNTELLLRSYDSNLLRLILESNERRKEEMKRMPIATDVEEIKKRVEALEKLALSCAQRAAHGELS